ncbi:MAG: 50S ribosomal protein L25 [Desulfobulbus sp.]|jgi:large subunit ribosomal protein L25
MLQFEIDSTVRTVFGKGPMRQLRMGQQTPANLYSGGKTPVALQLNTKDLFRTLLTIQGRNAVVVLHVAGDQEGTHHVLVQEVQKDPVNGSLIHVDFLEIDLEKAATFTVPLRYVGTAKGVDLGGELQIFRETVQLKGRPLDIPDMVEADITSLEQGGAGLTYADLVLPAGVEMLNKPTTVCVAVH